MRTIQLVWDDATWPDEVAQKVAEDLLRVLDDERRPPPDSITILIDGNTE